MTAVATKRNFSLFKKAKTSDAGMGRLEKEAFHRGYLGNEKAFESWLKRSTPKHSLLHHSRVSEKDLRRAFSLGESSRQEQEAAKKKISLLKQEKKESPKAPPVPKGEKLASLGEEYKGRQIRRTSKGFEVLGETWTTMNQAKEYVDLYNITGGKVRTKTNPKRKANAGPRSHRKTKKEAHKRMGISGKQPTPPAKKKNFADKYIKGKESTAEITQGKAKAQIYQAGSKAVATVIAANGSREEHTFNGTGSFKAAMSWARLRLHEVANPAGGWKLYPLSAKPRRKNPEDASVRMYEKFHGLPSTEVREYQEEFHRHEWLAGLGPLTDMVILNVMGNKEMTLSAPEPDTAKAGDVVMLCVEESGTQLYCTGGDQGIDFKVLKQQFGMVDTDIRDNMLIGTIKEITYRTRKKFEKNGKEVIDFYHALGSEGSRGVYPVLIYHPRDERMEIAGGRYFVGKVAAVLGNTSPGLIG